MAAISWGRTAQTMHLPDDVVFNILVRLPVKSLVKFRLVCKNWYSLITNPNFIDTHLQINVHKSNGYLLLPSRFMLSARVICKHTFSELFTLEMPFSFKFQYSIAGSSNGVICFFIDDPLCGRIGQVLILWNPSIRKFKSITNSSLDGSISGRFPYQVSLGFGYDDKKNDYKIVRFFNSAKHDRELPQAEVYSLKEDSWRTVVFPPIDDSRKLFSLGSSGCLFLNRALHWEATYVPEGTRELEVPVLLSFNFDDEKFRMSSIIGFEYNEMEFDRYLVEFNGSLALIVLCGEYTTSEIVLWVMEEYGLDKQCTKSVYPLKGVFDYCGRTEDGEFVFEKESVRRRGRTKRFGEGLALFDPKTLKKKKHLGIKDVEAMVTLTECLALL